MLWAHFAGMTAALITIVLATTHTGAAAVTADVRHNQSERQRIYFPLRRPQSMFIVTAAGVIATDPISERRPAKPYIDAIEAVTKAPIKYVIYSHGHFDHIAGGKPFKDLGATFVATAMPGTVSPR